MLVFLFHFMFAFFVHLFAKMEQVLGGNCDNLFQAVGFLYLFLDIHLSVAVF